MNTSSEFQHQDKPEASGGLECNICYESSTEPVTTTCGHIYCWSCIYKWLHAKPDNNYCPVCKNVVTEDKLIPLFTKNNTHHERKAEDIPKRPQPQREERKENNANAGRFNFGANPFFNSMFAGININMPNMAINVGFPTLIPMLIIFGIRFLSGLVSDFDEEPYQQPQQNSRHTGGYNKNSGYNTQNARSSRSANVDEPDHLLYNIALLAIIMLFFALPTIARKLRR